MTEAIILFTLTMTNIILCMIGNELSQIKKEIRKVTNHNNK